MNTLYFLAEQITVNSNDIGVPKISANNVTLDGILGQVFILIGSLAFVFMLIGAFRYVLSNGEASSVKQAKDTMLYSAIGVVIAVSAYTIVQFVSDQVTK